MQISILINPRYSIISYINIMSKARYFLAIKLISNLSPIVFSQTRKFRSNFPSRNSEYHHRRFIGISLQLSPGCPMRTWKPIIWEPKPRVCVPSSWKVFDERTLLGSLFLGRAHFYRAHIVNVVAFAYRNSHSCFNYSRVSYLITSLTLYALRLLSLGYTWVTFLRTEKRIRHCRTVENGVFTAEPEVNTVGSSMTVCTVL